MCCFLPLECWMGALLLYPWHIRHLASSSARKFLCSGTQTRVTVAWRPKSDSSSTHWIINLDLMPGGCRGNMAEILPVTIATYARNVTKNISNNCIDSSIDVPSLHLILLLTHKHRQQTLITKCYCLFTTFMMMMLMIAQVLKKLEVGEIPSHAAFVNLE